MQTNGSSTQSKAGGKRMTRHPSFGCWHLLCQYILSGRQQGVCEGVRYVVATISNVHVASAVVSVKTEGVASVQGPSTEDNSSFKQFLECEGVVLLHVCK